MKFDIPDYFKQAIEQDPAINSCVTNALSELFPWFLDNKLYFFPEFTDHGVDHINTVLRTADQLITLEAREKFNANDAGALILAILLHDCAMHLSWDGFQTLLSGQYVAQSSFYSNSEPPWPELFRSFLHDAQRWDQDKLVQILGAVRPIAAPPEDSIDVTEIDRRLVGEFLRIHHARLAHEISLLGVPGPLEKREKWITPIFNDSLPKDLIGFIARSHNLSLRSAKDRLPRHRQRSFLGIHAPYIMAVLRISDYLQIQSKRAHPSLLSIRNLKSSISVAEWNKHASTTDIHKHGEDPEALIVHTEPSDIGTLFALRSLFRSMQQELDNTWAALGEVYGRDSDLQSFGINGLSVRRLQTNISDLTQYEKEENPKYIPAELRLRSAGADMFNLLVAPLYNGDASVAIREIIQNAVDACIERSRYDESSGKSKTPMRIELSIHIAKDSPSFLLIRDNGIGMKLNTVKDYFLVAGASFRKSQWWKSQFSDEGGISTIQRSGRFGVGALATFLAGSKTTVTTRHADDADYGIQFSYSIDDKFIEAQRVKSEIGTTIRVDIEKPETVSYFRSALPTKTVRLHWFGLDNPKIECRIFIDERQHDIPRRFSLPSAGDELPENWRKFKPENYDSILWTYTKFATGEYPRNPLFCNGIYISDNWATEPHFKISPGSPSIDMSYPTLSVFDSNGNFPLNLARNKVASKLLPFQKDFEASVSDYFVHRILDQWKDRKSPTKDAARDFNVHGAIQHQIHHFSVIKSIFARCKHGACLLDQALLSSLNFSRILVVPQITAATKKNFINEYLEIEGAFVVECGGSSSVKGDTESFFRAMMSSTSYDIKFFENLGRKIISQSIYSSNSSFSVAREKSRVPQYYFGGWAIEEGAKKNIRAWRIDRGPRTEDISILDSLLTDGFVAEFVFSENIEAASKETPLSQAWRRAGKKNALLEN